MAKTKENSKKKETKEEVEVTGLDQINFDLIFRVKGLQGLFKPVTEFSKSNMARCVNILYPGEAWNVVDDTVEVLSHFEFTTYVGNDNLGVKDVFQNMINHLGDNPEYVFKDGEPSENMAIMLPEFDEDKFKNYHSRKVIAWFEIIQEKLEQLEDEKNTGKDKKGN